FPSSTHCAPSLPPFLLSVGSRQYDACWSSLINLSHSSVVSRRVRFAISFPGSYPPAPSSSLNTIFLSSPLRQTRITIGGWNVRNQRNRYVSYDSAIESSEGSSIALRCFEYHSFLKEFRPLIL